MGNSTPQALEQPPYVSAETKAASGLCRGPGGAIAITTEGEAGAIQTDVPAAGAGARYLLILLGFRLGLRLLGYLTE